MDTAGWVLENAGCVEITGHHSNCAAFIKSKQKNASWDSAARRRWSKQQRRGHKAVMLEGGRNLQRSLARSLSPRQSSLTSSRWEWWWKKANSQRRLINTLMSCTGEAAAAAPPPERTDRDDCLQPPSPSQAKGRCCCCHLLKLKRKKKEKSKFSVKTCHWLGSRAPCWRRGWMLFEIQKACNVSHLPQMWFRWCDREKGEWTEDSKTLRYKTN